MKIGIDIQTTLGQKTGFGFYVKNLVEELKELDSNHHYKLFAPTTQKDFSAPQRWWWDQVEMPKEAFRSKIDILHQPAFSAPIFYPGKVVVTVHDLIAMVYGEDIPFFSRQFFGRWMPYSYRRADHIISISSHTKKDLIRILGIPENKITVIYLATSNEFKPIKDRLLLQSIQKKYNTGAKYLLHVGTLNPRKNIGLLINVFAHVVRRFPEYRLVITGKKGWYYEGLFEKVDALGLKNKVIFTGYVADEDKPALYSGATLFLFPSLYEGFGLPPLEAMSCGVPVIASKESSIPEVVGKAGVLLPPKDEAAWVREIIRVLGSASLKKIMIAKSLAQAKQFSWTKTALETVKVYEKVNRSNS